jgi:hypothetical protein
MLGHIPGPSPLRPTGAAVAGAALVALAVAPGAARATSGHEAASTLCGGSQTVAYSPGLTTRTREVTLHGTSTLDRCASTADPGITAARSTFRATGRVSCVSGRYSGVREVAWNNGRTSTMSFESLVSVTAGHSVVAIRGRVTDGEFRGQRWSATFTMFAARPAACLTPAGLPTAAGRLVLGVGSPVPGSAVADHEKPTLR